MKLHCASATVDEPLDLVSVGHFVRDDHSLLWLRPGDDDGIIAWGEVADWAPDTDHRTAAEFAAHIARAMPVSPQPALIVGGFAFDPDRAPSGRWDAFRSGRLIVPATQIIRRDGTITVQTFAADAKVADRRLRDAARMIELARFRGLIEFDELDITIEDETADHYHGIVKRAVEAIENTSLDKVVLARAIDIHGEIPLGAWLASLRARYSTCAVFARGEGERTFFGASPETLVRVVGDEVSTAALAGTRPRGDDDTADDALGTELMTSSKERAEHQFVVDEVRRKLAATGVRLDRPAETKLMRIPGIQHLFTPVSGHRPANLSILDLVEALHPTPAVGGTPNASALAWIRDNEDLDRGWYAAPVGWTDTSGQGEFRVGLRSGLFSPTTTRLFAGCGIGAESNPDDELEETRTKLSALLSCLGQQ